MRVFEFDAVTDSQSVEETMAIIKEIDGVVSVGLVRAQTESSWPEINVVVRPFNRKVLEELHEMFVGDETQSIADFELV